MSFDPSHLGFLAPYLILAITGMVLVLAEAFYRGKDRSALMSLAVAGSFASAIASVVLYRQLGDGAHVSLLGDMLVADRTGYVLSALFAVTTAFAALISPAHQREHDWQVGEYYGVMLLSASGMVMLAHAANLVTVFLGIENMSLGVYVMCAMRRKSRRGNEAAMKYFLIGAFATGFLMYGIALLYGAAGTTKIAELATKLAVSKNPSLVVAGGLLLVIAFGFKVAAVPFHMWAPDAYEGAPTPVTGFMAAAVKAAAIAAMIRVFGTALGGNVVPVGALGWAGPLA
ncbi:MAG TPA: proton-conducting transporter membrane subunit, partial [Kofleriaceae bacterium]|nr:proton-conducting transporter membrane subunit [Kofleriaceae bacterium]